MPEQLSLTMSRIDWGNARESLRGKIAADDERIVELLSLGKSTPDIAKEIGTNRSAVWRRVQRIKQLL